MKMMKWALLGGAAFAVMSTSAQADELSALKAQLEALQTRVSQLEAQPATSMPSGYSLLSIRDGGGNYSTLPQRQEDRIDPNSGVTISVLPTAEMAPVAEVSVSGEIRTLVVYSEDDADTINTDNSVDVTVRGRLVAKGKVDTAVGEVGGYIRLQGGDFFDKSEAAGMHDAYGWWKFAPNWQIFAGFTDTTAAVQAGVDWDFTVGATGGPSDKRVEQLRLVFGTEGPFSFAIAVEDTDTSRIVTTGFVSEGTKKKTIELDARSQFVTGTAVDRGNWPDIAGYIMYNNNKLMLQAVGVVQDDQSKFTILNSQNDTLHNSGGKLDWGVGGGARLGIGDMFTLTAAGVYADGYNGWANDFNIANDDRFWAASAGVLVNVAEHARLEIGGGYEEQDVDVKTPFYDDRHVWTVTGGLYWDPVSQVTIGVQANWQQFDFKANGEKAPEDDPGPKNFDRVQARFGTWLRFP
jgi:hypothetical protein